MTPGTTDRPGTTPKQEGQAMQPDSTQDRSSVGELLAFGDDEAAVAARASRREARREAARREALLSRRGDVLWVASRLTRTPEDADAVMSNARPLLSWIEDAPDAADQEVRWQAMRRQCWNEDRPDDDPDRFLAETGKLYAFLNTGQDG